MISEITDKSSVIIKAIGHKWDDGEITKEATYDEDGEKTYTCQNDPSHTKIEIIPKKTGASDSDSDNITKENDSSSGTGDDGVVDSENKADTSGDSKADSGNSADTNGSSANVSRRIGGEIDSGSSSSSGSGSSSSDSGSSSGSSNSGSSSKTNTTAQAKVDQVNNVTSFKVPENHQVESGVPASDIGGKWGNSANTDTWTYTKSDGTLAKGEWLSLDYNGLRYWYYFNDDGNMHTNWFDYKGERFYLMPQKDGWRGKMATGWKNIDNKWYYFDILPGSSQGRLYRSSVTPDGHTVGADGAWNGVGTTPLGQA